MENMVLTVGFIIVVIIAVCEALKMAGLSSRFIPIVSIALGIGFALIVGQNNWLTVVAGVIQGLASSGLYSGLKKTILNK